MKRTWCKLLPGIVILIACANLAIAQGFVNLSFENAIYPLTSVGGSDVTTDSAVPGWRTYQGSSQVSAVLYNTVGLGGAVISFHDGLGSQDPNYQPYQGLRHMFLQSGFFPAPADDVALGQSGQIPANSLSLRLAASAFALSGPPVVTFDGQPIQLYDLGLAPGSTLYHHFAGDISPYAGTIGELRIGTFRNNLYLDDIQFSSTAVPEPSTWALLALGSALLCYAARRRRK